MKDQGLFLGKILALSLAISLFIRYAIPHFNIPATPAVALFLVLTPMLVMTGLLIWRGKSQLDS